MTALFAAVVDWEALLDVIVASLVAAVGVTAAFSLAINGAVRFADRRRAGQTLEAGAFFVVVLFSVGACVAAVVFGIILMTTK